MPFPCVPSAILMVPSTSNLADGVIVPMATVSFANIFLHVFFADPKSMVLATAGKRLWLMAVLADRLFKDVLAFPLEICTHAVPL